MRDGTGEGTFLVQVEEEAGARLERSGGAVVELPEKRLDEAAEFAHRAAKKLEGLFAGAGPDSGSIEFALNFEASTGVPVLAKGTVGAALTITLNWEKG